MLTPLRFQRVAEDKPLYGRSLYITDCRRFWIEADDVGGKKMWSTAAFYNSPYADAWAGWTDKVGLDDVYFTTRRELLAAIQTQLELTDCVDVVVPPVQYH